MMGLSFTRVFQSQDNICSTSNHQRRIYREIYFSPRKRNSSTQIEENRRVFTQCVLSFEMNNRCEHIFQGGKSHVLRMFQHNQTMVHLEQGHTWQRMALRLCVRVWQNIYFIEPYITCSNWDFRCFSSIWPHRT